MMMTVFTLWKREVVRFYRQPSRIVGAVGSPLMFWLVIGAGIGSSFKSETSLEGATYLQYFFPGTILLVLMFTAIFSTISLIEDKKEGFFQAVMVAPVSRSGIVLGKVLGGSTLALFQAALFLLFSPLIGVSLGATEWIRVICILTLGSFLLTSLGFTIAWQFQSIQGFHAVMNLFLMPLWMLSGALFPSTGASGIIQWLMKLNPLSYLMTALREALYPGVFGEPFVGFSMAALITIIFGFFIFFLGYLSAKRRRVEDVI